MSKLIKNFVLLLVLSLLVFSGCAEKTNVTKDNTSNNKKITVYTSFYAMYDFTKKIGGDKINLINLVPAGTEPHDWEPTPREIANLEKADVLIYNGAGFESWVSKVLVSLNNEKLITVETSKGLKLLDNKDKDPKLKYDPHVWLNPRLAKIQMEVIKNTLVKADPINKDFYEKNYTDNARKIDDLDNEYKTTLSKLEKRDMIVAHQAFGYICDAYGLKQVAIEGLNADAEPTPERMAEIVKFAKRNNVKYIFFEDLISPKVADTIAREIGAKTQSLNPLEGLKDVDIKSGKDYFSVMKDNLVVLKKALE